MCKVLFILSVIVCSCVSNPGLAYLSFDNALEAGMKKIETELPEGAQVAIIDFKSDNENLSSYIVEEMHDKLINFGKLSVMERSRTDAIAMEVGYQLSGEVDDNEIINIGHQLGADFVVTGQIIFSGEAYRLRVFAINIEQGRRIASSSLNINQGDKQINHLLSTKSNNSSRDSRVNSDTRNDEEILLISIQNVLKNVPGNSRVLIAGISGSNGIQEQYIQSMILSEANGMILITEEQRQNTLDRFQEQFSGLYDDKTLPLIQILGANIIITGGVFGTGDVRRIVFRALNVETEQVISSSCMLFSQSNTEILDDVDALIQKINYSLNKNINVDSGIAVYNDIGTVRNADFVYDMLENNLVNQNKYKVVARQKYNRDLINKEIKFQLENYVADETIVTLGRFIGADYVLRMNSIGSNIQVTLGDVPSGSIITQEILQMHGNK